MHHRGTSLAKGTTPSLHVIELELNGWDSILDLFDGDVPSSAALSGVEDIVLHKVATLQGHLQRATEAHEKALLAAEREEEEEPPVRTGRLTGEVLKYLRRANSKPDQTRSRRSRRRSIERRGRSRR